MTDIVERLRSRIKWDTCVPAEMVMEDAAQAIESLRQQLAECQARMIKTAVFPIDKTLLDNLIKQATHESVLRVIAEWEKPYGLTDGTPFIDRLRRMAKELE